MNTENTKEVETNDATASELKRLLPCPFCGNKPTYRVGSEHSFIGGWSNNVILECCIEMDEMFGSNQMGERDEQEAKEDLFKRWNARAG